MAEIRGPDLPRPGRPEVDHRTGALLSELGAEMRRLFRAELALSKLELQSEARQAAKAGGLLAGGAIAGFIAALCLAAFLVIALAGAMPAWLSALLVALAFGGGGAALVMSGWKKLQDVRPKKAFENLKEDGQWASETMRAAKSEWRGNA